MKHYDKDSKNNFNNHNLSHQCLYHNPVCGDGKGLTGFGTYTPHLAQKSIIKVSHEFVVSLW